MSAQPTITAEDLIEAMVQADVLETFCRLPQAEQAKFSRWIGKARNDASHWQRIQALVLALRMGPLQPITVEEPVSSAGAP